MTVATAPSPFRKRTFAPGEYGRSVAAVLRHGPTALLGLIRPRTSRLLREEVMLSVTAVNDCRYCDWVHTRAALRHGADLDALGETLGRSIDDPRATREQVASLYAQHYASTSGRPDASAREALAAVWNRAERAEINAFIAVIFFSNLTGNSADAWIARLRGRPVDAGHPVAEALAAVVGAPILAGIYLHSRGLAATQVGPR